MTQVDDRSFNVFVEADGRFDRRVAAVARELLEDVLREFERHAERKPQLREVAERLGMLPRRTSRVLEVLNLRNRCRTRKIKGGQGGEAK